MAWEVGKSRLEALGDVEESADLIRYYTHEMRAHDGFEQPMERLAPAEATYDVMRPYGVWGVISPFNYPMALVAGPAGAALAAGNTVVLKPSEIGSWCAHRFYDVLVEAGVPAGCRQPRHRTRRDDAAPRSSPTTGWAGHVHRVERRRDGDPPLVLDATARARRSARWAARTR